VVDELAIRAGQSGDSTVTRFDNAIALENGNLDEI
jgi:hypothetical protein